MYNCDYPTEGWLLQSYCDYWGLVVTMLLRLLTVEWHAEYWNNEGKTPLHVSSFCSVPRLLTASQPPPARGVSQIPEPEFCISDPADRFKLLFFICLLSSTNHKIPLLYTHSNLLSDWTTRGSPWVLYNLLIFKSITNTTVFISYFAKEVIKSSAPQKCNKLRLWRVSCFAWG